MSVRRALAMLLAGALVTGAATASAAQAPSLPPAPPPVALTGITGLARAYDAVFDADFDRAAGLIREACPPAPAEACLVLEATRQFWRIQIDPEDRSRDAALEKALTAAID